MGKQLFTPFLGLLLGASVASAEPTAPAAPATPAPAAPAPASPALAGTAEPAVSLEDSHATGFLSSLRALGGPGHELTAEADYMLWIIPKRQHALSVAATDVQGAADSAPLGILTSEPLSRHLVQGGQFTLGYWETEPNVWMPNCVVRDLGVEGRFLFVAERSVGFVSDHSPVLVRPFFDENDRTESAVVVAAPGLATGELTARVKADLWGSEINVWKNLYPSCLGSLCYLDAVAGFRFLDYSQDLSVGRSTMFLSDLSAFPQFLSLAGSRIQETESFTGRNRFYGGQVGIRGTMMLEHGVLASATAKLALGATSEDLAINGSQVKTAADGTTSVSQGALLALPSNIGRFNQTRFTTVPELDLNLSVPVLDRLRLSVGFDALFWNRIIRAVDQVQREIDITQIPSFPGVGAVSPTGLQRPGVPFNQSSFFILGVSFGAEFRW